MTTSTKIPQEIGTVAVTAEESEKALRYYSATQWQLMWWRFKHHRVALAAGSVLVFMAFLGLFAGFLAPYAGVIRDRECLLGP
ncbi:MAG: ABC transporter permease, partial [Deltaproteobacteria bacterium]|nr:ABC transporter permease [Deltaproteobacteria bacterium]